MSKTVGSLPREGDTMLIHATVASVVGGHIRVRIGKYCDFWPDPDDIHSVKETIKTGDIVETVLRHGLVSISGRSIFADAATVLIETDDGGRFMRTPGDVRRRIEPSPAPEIPPEHEPFAPAEIDGPEMEGV